MDLSKLPKHTVEYQVCLKKIQGQSIMVIEADEIPNERLADELLVCAKQLIQYSKCYGRHSIKESFRNALMQVRAAAWLCFLMVTGRFARAIERECEP